MVSLENRDPFEGRTLPLAEGPGPGHRFRRLSFSVRPRRSVAHEDLSGADLRGSGLPAAAGEGAALGGRFEAVIFTPCADHGGAQVSDGDRCPQRMSPRTRLPRSLWLAAASRRRAGG